MKTRSFILAAVAGAALSTVSIQSAEAAPGWAKSGDTIVKCRGIAKKGANDCGANGHDCANQAKADNDAKEWVYVPQGVCKKIAGGVVFKSKKIK
jgi:uncharacterized membrane protein